MMKYIWLQMQAVVSFGGVKPEQKEEAEKLGLVIHAWDEFLNLVGDFHLHFLTSLLVSFSIFFMMIIHI